MTNLDSILKTRDITLPTNVCLIKALFFSSSHVWMWELDYKESWARKNWCFWTVVLEKTLESLLDCKEIQSVHPKGVILEPHMIFSQWISDIYWYLIATLIFNQSWIFIGRADAEAEISILWHSDEKNWLIWKDPDSGKDWRQEERWMTEDEMVGWHHQLNGQAKDFSTVIFFFHVHNNT